MAKEPDNQTTILKEGWLLKQGQVNPAFKKRWCVLRSNGTIDYYDIPKPKSKSKSKSPFVKPKILGNSTRTSTRETSPQAVDNKKKEISTKNDKNHSKNEKDSNTIAVAKIYKGTVDLKDVKSIIAQTNQKQGFCFWVDTPKRRWIFATDRNESRQEWINYLRQSCNYNVFTENEMFIKLPKNKKYKKFVKSKKRDYYGFQVTLKSAKLILMPLKQVTNNQLIESPILNDNNNDSDSDTFYSKSDSHSHSHSKSKSNSNYRESPSMQSLHSKSNSKSKNFLKWPNNNKNDKNLTNDNDNQNVSGYNNGSPSPMVIDETKSQSKCETLPTGVVNVDSSNALCWDINEIAIIKYKANKNKSPKQYCSQLQIMFGKSEKFSQYIKIQFNDEKMDEKWQKLLKTYCFNAEFKTT